MTMSAICHEYRSHTVGSRKSIVLPGGKLLSLIPQRCICRQSNIGDANWDE